MSDSSSKHIIYLSWAVSDQHIAESVLRVLDEEGFDVINAVFPRSDKYLLPREPIIEQAALFIGIYRGESSHIQVQEYEQALAFNISILPIIKDVARDSVNDEFIRSIEARNAVVRVKRDEEIVETIRYHVRKFFNIVGSFKDGGAAKTKTVRASESNVAQTGSQVAASQPTKFGYNPELEKLLRAELDHELLRAESDRERPVVAQAIREVLARPGDADAARGLARMWEELGEYEKAAVVYREIQSRQPEDEKAQQALKELQEKRSAPTVETSEPEQTLSAQTPAHEQTSTPDETGASPPETDAPEEKPPIVKFSDDFRYVFSRAEALRVLLRQPRIDAPMLLTSLFLNEEKNPAFLVLSTFGITAETLLARLWETYGRTYPASLTPEQLQRESHQVFQFLTMHAENPGKPRLPFDFDLQDDVSLIIEKIGRFAIQDTEAHSRHVFWTLMHGDTTGWIEATLGKRETACIKRLLEKKGFDANIAREDVLDAAVADRLFVNPPAYRDSAAVDDLLGFEDYANALVDIIRKPETRPPLVVGVYGPWGSGKSTFMGIVKKKLDALPPAPLESKNSWARRLSRTLKRAAGFRDNMRRRLRAFPLVEKLISAPPPVAPVPLKVVTIEYDAWAYADTPKLWSGLIGKIAKELDAELGWRGRLAYLCKRHSRALLAAVVVGLVPVLLLTFNWLGHAFGGFIVARQFGTGFSNFVRRIGLNVLVENDAALGKVAGLLTSLAGLLYAFVLQKRPVTDAVTALAARFDSAPAAGIVSRIQDEFKTALETKINPAEKPETDDTRKSKIRQRVEQNQLKIVVFIDELDRCPLERIVDILEAIKLFLAEDIFIVFLGVDTRVAAEAIRLHYKEVKNPDLPREYLEKIVQLPLRVPTADSTKLKDYLKSFMPELFKAADAATTTTPQPLAPEKKSEAQASPALTSSGDNGHQSAFKEERVGATVGVNDATGATDEEDDNPESQSKQDSTQAAIGGMKLYFTRRAEVELEEPRRELKAISTPPSLPDTEYEFNCIAKLAAGFLESNPRRIKRLLNTYRYVKILANVSGEPVGAKSWQEAMLGWLAFTMKWPAFMEQAIEAAEEERERAEATRAGNNGHTPPTNSANFLQTLLRKDAERDQQPTEQEIKEYLPFDAAQITHHYQLAGNFLIENPRPYADSRAPQKQTPTPNATTTNTTMPRARKSKDAKEGQ